MSRTKLVDALSAVGWATNVSTFVNDVSRTERMAKVGHRLAIWSKQLEIADHGNPALSFIREMQVAAQYVPTLASLSLYKPAAGSMRIMFETALYYTYFRTHFVELATLTRESKYYVHKSDLMDFHVLHTPRFRVLEQKFGLVGRIEEWYKEVSAVVHGQIPGAWVAHTGLAKIKPDEALLELATRTFEEGGQAIHTLLLCAVAAELWVNFDSAAKKMLLAGLTGDQKIELGLDSA